MWPKVTRARPRSARPDWFKSRTLRPRFKAVINGPRIPSTAQAAQKVMEKWIKPWQKQLEAGKPVENDAKAFLAKFGKGI